VLVIGSAKVTLAAGHSENVLVRLDTTGRRLLQHWRTLATLVDVRAQSGVQTSRIVRLRARSSARR
jgi:hypothetical protein